MLPLCSDLLLQLELLQEAEQKQSGFVYGSLADAVLHEHASASHESLVPLFDRAPSEELDCQKCNLVYCAQHPHVLSLFNK